jgi:tRNA threonylcarbamoyl adenosine modification protein YeaZ
MNKPFPILAVETTAELCSVAVAIDEVNFIELNHLQKHIHSEKLMEMIDVVIKQSSIPLKEYFCIAISIGPGSFTGLRIGMSAVKGLAFGANLPIVSVPTFAAMSLQVSEYMKEGQKFNLLVNASIDDYYFAKYIVGKNKLDIVSALTLEGKNKLDQNINLEEINFGNLASEKYLIRDIKLTAKSVARWAYLFGMDLLTFDYDNLEPNYLKQFVGKVKK